MRQCGGCTLCCKLIPVEEIVKPAGHRCVHQRHGKGCAIYDRRPISCREWSCMWLIGTEDEGPLQLSRPDRAHYVIDTAPDLIRLRDDATGEVHEMPVMVVWCDPAHPDAWSDPALLAMLDRQGIVALIRYSSKEAFAIAPPSRNKSGRWERSAKSEAVNTPDLERARHEARTEFWIKALTTQPPKEDYLHASSEEASHG